MHAALSTKGTAST